MELRRIIDRKYSSSRGIATGIDRDLGARDLLDFLARKLLQRFGGAIRGRPNAYIAFSSRIRGARHLVMQPGVIIGSHVVIDAVAKGGIRLGDRVTIDQNATLRGSGVVRRLGVGITVGSRTSIGAYNFIQGAGGVQIGADCLLGPFVSIFSENHRFDDSSLPIREQGEERKRVTIGDDVWIGANSVIVAGVHIGSHTIVAAGSVVTRDLESDSVYGGVPARKIRDRETTS